MATTEDALLEAIGELKQVVRALTKVIEEDYPKRKEVETRFTTKQTAARRFSIVTAFIVISLIVSYFVSISTVSVCFLSQDQPASCELIPGYSASKDHNLKILNEFIELQQRSLDNERRIDRLENAQ